MTRCSQPQSQGPRLTEDMAHISEEQEAEILPLDLDAPSEPAPIESGPAKDDVTAKTLPIFSKTQADLCPECGEATFVFEEGCKKCHSCGYSMC